MPRLPINRFPTFDPGPKPMTRPNGSPATRVILAVFDGMRPDMISEKTTPNLMRLARRGIWFREARSVFPSMTRVATTSIATGAPPRVHGIVGNAFYWPAAARKHALDTSLIDDIALLEASDGRAATATTFGDQLALAGRKLAIVHTGSAGSAYLLNPRARANGHWTFSALGEDHTQTPEAVRQMIARFGALPPRSLPRFEEIDYAATVMTEHVLPVMQPDAAVVWFNEPDTSFHYKFIGAADSMAVIRHADAAFGRILDWVDAQPDADRFAIIAASDHGQIATSAEINLAGRLTEAGHRAVRAADRNTDGAAVAITGGNMGEIRILDGGAERSDAIARWLMEQPWIGHVLSRARNEIEGEAEGTFAISAAGLDHARQPDLVYVLKSNEDRDPQDWPGVGLMTGGVPLGGGMHGGFNRYEQNTLLIGAGAGWSGADVMTSAPAGIIDIAPTILDLLGVERASTMTGKSLLDAAADEAEIKIIETGVGSFRQRLAYREADGRRFIVSGQPQ
ncbi:alkaline phosphatase family protein [Terrarubrum flagellatum]|uniref:alkaline phosphatase family protein n=1 Tax=Terrirubrum flagellatum TaxID=2895980 RepID=UPI003144F6F2